MLYHNDGISGIDKLGQHILELIDIGGVKSRCRFVENIERFAGIAPCKLGRKLDTLRLTARKSCGGLTDFNLS